MNEINACAIIKNPYTQINIKHVYLQQYSFDKTNEKIFHYVYILIYFGIMFHPKNYSPSLITKCLLYCIHLIPRTNLTHAYDNCIKYIVVL